MQIKYKVIQIYFLNHTINYIFTSSFFMIFNMTHLWQILTWNHIYWLDRCIFVQSTRTYNYFFHFYNSLCSNTLKQPFLRPPRTFNILSDRWILTARSYQANKTENIIVMHLATSKTVAGQYLDSTSKFLGMYMISFSNVMRQFQVL